MNNQYKQSILVIDYLVVVLILLIDLSSARGQYKESISDFYDYANAAWIESTVLHEHTSVVNNWGIHWDKIIDKSIEILSSDSTYTLDENHAHTLIQLQNFYKSAIEFGSEKEKVQLVQKHYPMLLGILFSKITVPESKAKQVNEVIEYLKIAYREKIENSNNIGKYYKDLFLKKLETMEFEVGAPSLSDFPQIPKLSADSLESNIQLSNIFRPEMDNVKSDWNTPPFETDCYYNFHDNKVKIYAGILYDPNITVEADFVYLFATLGRTISHEMTHAFDNIGMNYDQNGEYINWFEKLFSGALFSKNDLKTIHQTLAEQYNQYTILDTLFVDGLKTVQENIADLGGVEISIEALQLYIEENEPLASESEKNESLRKYFISYAQLWREKATPAFELFSLNRLHTPQKFRAIGPIYNQNEFYEVFRIDKNSKYYIPLNHRISLW